MSVLAEVKDLRRRRYERPLPTVYADHGPSVPGAVFRVAGAVSVFGLVLLAASRTALVPDVVLTVAAVLAAWAAVRPGRVPTHVAVVVSAAFLLGSTSAPFDPAVLWLAPLALVTVRLGWWAEHVGWQSRVEAAALARSSRRDVVIVGVTEVLGGAAWAVSGLAIGGLVALGAAALVVLGWHFLPR